VLGAVVSNQFSVISFRRRKEIGEKRRGEKKGKEKSSEVGAVELARGMMLFEYLVERSSSVGPGY
jgi:hypothetical protein